MKHGLLCSVDPVRFVREKLGFHADEFQQGLIKGRHKRALVLCCRQFGKSTTTAALVVCRAYSKPGSLILVLSPTMRQSGEFLAKAAAFLRCLEISRRGDNINPMSLLLPNGSRIVGLSDVEATVRGYSGASLIVIDEAARISDPLYKAIRPILSPSNGDLWMLSTPYGKRGVFYREWSSGKRWTRLKVTAPECPRISPEFLAEERETLGDRWFRQEYLCEFLDTDTSVFAPELVEACLTDDVRPLFPDLL